MIEHVDHRARIGLACDRSVAPPLHARLVCHLIEVFPIEEEVFPPVGPPQNLAAPPGGPGAGVRTLTAAV